MNLKHMLTEMLKRKSSDLHLRVGIKPYLRTNGILDQIVQGDRLERVVVVR